MHELPMYGAIPNNYKKSYYFQNFIIQTKKDKKKVGYKYPWNKILFDIIPV